MALRARIEELAPHPVSSASTWTDLSGSEDAASSVASPALELQMRLAEAYASPAGFDEPWAKLWPAPIRMGVLIGLVVVGWSLVLAGVWVGACTLRWVGVVR